MIHNNSILDTEAIPMYSFGSSSTAQVYICDSHPEYCGSYIYTMAEMEKACNSAPGNFIRLNE